MGDWRRAMEDGQGQRARATGKGNGDGQGQRVRAMGHRKDCMPDSVGIFWRHSFSPSRSPSGSKWHHHTQLHNNSSRAADEKNLPRPSIYPYIQSNSTPLPIIPCIIYQDKTTITAPIPSATVPPAVPPPPLRPPTASLTTTPSRSCGLPKIPSPGGCPTTMTSTLNSKQRAGCLRVVSVQLTKDITHLNPPSALPHPSCLQTELPSLQKQSFCQNPICLNISGMSAQLIWWMAKK